jgi:hypothetical protein
MTIAMYPEELTWPRDPSLGGADQLAAAFAHAASAELSDSLGLIEHCLGQLTEDEVWRRSSDGLNSISNLLLHLTGNLQQWAVAGVTGERDDRRRLDEFSARGGITKEDLARGLRDCVDRARAAIATATPDELLRIRRVQGFAVSGMAALWHTVAHFRGHTQEIIGMTRQILGPRYRFAWAPRTAEEGAAAGTC